MDNLLTYMYIHTNIATIDSQKLEIGLTDLDELFFVLMRSPG